MATIPSMKRALTAVAVAALLASCSQGTEWVDPANVTEGPTTELESSGPGPSVAPPAQGTKNASQGRGQFACLDITTRANYAFTIPTATTHPIITQLEELRTEAGIARKPHYIVVRIDATGASQEPGMQDSPPDFTIQRLLWHGPAAKQSMATDVQVLLSSWVRDLGPEDPVAQKIRRAAETLNLPVEGGGTGEQVLSTSSPITTVSDPTISLRSQRTVACANPQG